MHDLWTRWTTQPWHRFLLRGVTMAAAAGLAATTPLVEAGPWRTLFIFWAVIWALTSIRLAVTQ